MSHHLARWTALVVLVSFGFNALAESRPNILLIVADDLGYADLGSFGSDIKTPNIDNIAKRGLTFTQFHTAAMCSPTRAMLLSGNNNHVAGIGRQSAYGPLNKHLPGYEDYLSDRIVPFPELLQSVGYFTAIAGKWHLGRAIEHSPKQSGFDRSFVNLFGAANHFDQVGFTKKGTVYAEDGVEVDYPDGEYSTEVFTDRLIGYMQEAEEKQQPFFAFAAYTSPHWPLQVPDKELKKYRGKYRKGYDHLREKNFAALEKAGVLPDNALLPPRNPAIVPWDELDKASQQRESRKMELYAAMVENLDRHIGQLVKYLHDSDQYDNTLIVFMSDNGAAAEDFYNRGPYKSFLREHYNNDLSNMGKPGSFVSYGPQWAEAGSAPFSRHKMYSTNGGLIAPMIIAGPDVPASGQRNHAFVTVMDLAPTFLELGKGSYPASGFAQPLGTSLAPLLSGKVSQIHDKQEVFLVSHRGRAMLRQGDWKILTLEPPFDEARFQLYNVVDDPGESIDLSAQHPEKRDDLIQLWRTHRREMGIVLPQDL